MLEMITQYFIDAFNNNFEAQIVGTIALFIFLYGYTQKDDKKAIKLVLFSMFFWAMHFYLLEVYTAFVAASISIVRVALSMKYKKNIYVFTGIIISVFIGGAITYNGMLSLLPILASLVGSYAYFFTEKIFFRSLMLSCSIMWLTQNYFTGSIPGVINESLAILIMISTLYRLGTFEGKVDYYKEKVLDTLHHRPKIDFGRFGVINYYKNMKK